METFDELKTAIERLTLGENHAELTNNSQKISDLYRSGSGCGKRLLTGEKEALAYSVARMPATLGAVSAALRAALEFANCNPASLLDVGAGTGASAWAADALLDLESIACLERENVMLQTGMELMKESALAGKTKWMQHDLTIGKLSMAGDIVTASYVLNELRREDRLRMLEELWSAARMLLLIVEPGTPEGCRQMLENRDALIRLGAHIAAPCPHSGACMMGESWCHFKCRVPRSRLHKQLKGGDAPYEDEKFTYIAVTREKCRPAEARIIRHPYFDKGRVTLEVCTHNGISKTVITKKDGELFKKARKAKCGDAIELHQKS